MPLKPGTMLGPYEVLAQIGAGGMGEVYKGLDTRLNRDVAIKVLPEHLALNAELRERFQREAETIAKLNHPNICVLYDIGEQGPTPGGSGPQGSIQYLVMEYIEGETLAARLLKGPLPLEQTLRYAIEISDALDKAHRKGATHRDIKPGNIMLTKIGGTLGTKLLDFGLAKLKQQAAVKPVALASDAPTPPAASPPAGSPTLGGTILGTVQYMAPEQVEGRVDDIDGRSDIFSFDATVYEMLTGKKAFEGKSAASVMSKIMQVDPPAISSLDPPGKKVPPALDRVIKKCLAKEQEDRWQSARDLHDELDWIKSAGTSLTAEAPVAARPKITSWAGWAVAALAVLIAILLRINQSNPAAPNTGVVRSSVLTPENLTLLSDSAPIISPDGRALAFTGTDASGKVLLWIRALDSLDMRPLVGTEGATYPFWSPDSRSLGFFAGGKLKKIEVSSGGGITLADAPSGRGGTWNREGLILFAPNNVLTMGLYSVPSAGGAIATSATTLDTSRNETGQRYPEFLPDGRHFLYMSRGTSTAIYLGSVDSKETKKLVDTNFRAVFVPPGYLLYINNGALLAQAFDPKSLELSGEAAQVVADVGTVSGGYASFSASESGVLAYRTFGALSAQFAWFDRNGKNLGSVGESGSYTEFTLSPDEKRAAVKKAFTAGGDTDIWLLELSRGIFSRLSPDPSPKSEAHWSPDGRQLTFRTVQKNRNGIYRRTLDTGEEELLLESASNETPTPKDWSRDGRFIVWIDISTQQDLRLLPLFGDRKSKLLTETPSREERPQFSPDVRWIAYNSDESGNWEVYVQPFPGPGEKVRISTNGGVQANWRADGRELFYQTLDGSLMAAPLKPGTKVEAGIPRPLFRTPIVVDPVRHQYAVSADGQRFLVLAPVGGQATAPITIVQNWTAALKK